MPRLLDSSEYFTSAKTRRPIMVDSGPFRDALIRATLDPAVRTIGPLSGRTSACNLATVVRDDGAFVYGVEDEFESLPALNQHGMRSLLRPLILVKTDLYREPALSNDRLIWSHKKRRVSNGLRFQVLQTLAVDGPMPLGDLISVVRIPRRSMVAAFALACADLIEFDDLSFRPVGIDTVVRSRSHTGLGTRRGVANRLDAHV
jgi:hypothetical protein